MPAERAEKIGKIGNCSKAEVVSPPFVLLLRKGGKSMPVKASPRGGNSRPTWCQIGELLAAGEQEDIPGWMDTAWDCSHCGAQVALSLEVFLEEEAKRLDWPPGGNLGLAFAAWLGKGIGFLSMTSHSAVPNGAKTRMSRGLEQWRKARRAGNVQPGEEKLQGDLTQSLCWSEV